MTAQAEFPIPSDLDDGFYLWDQLHCPRPLTPLEHELLLGATSYGFSKAIGDMGSSIVAKAYLINYYNYLHGSTATSATSRRRSGTPATPRTSKN